MVKLRFPLPSDWKLRSLEAISEFSQYGINSSSGEGKEYPMLRMNNLQNGRIDASDLAYIRLSDEEYDKFRLGPNDLLVNRTNSCELVGKTALFSLLGEYVFASYLVRFRLNAYKVDPKYVEYYFNYHEAKHFLQTLATKGVSQANINPTILKKRFVIPLPPLPEQRAIAAILGTWDRAIALTERRLAAAERRKRALMQQLLTGRVRFPEFLGEEWREVRLGEVFTRVTRKTPPDVANILSISARIGFEHQADKFSRVIAGDSLSRYILLRRGEFAYNKGNSKAYPQGCIYRLEDHEEGAVPNVYYCFKAKSDVVNGLFYKYYFESGALNPKLRGFINAGVRNDGLLNLNVDDFFSCTIVLPSPAEQERIASVLDAATREISLLRRKRDALQRQKQGLMQRLLTGRVRVKV